MRVKADKPMRRQYRSTSDWEIFDPASKYSEFNTSRSGGYIENLFAFSRVEASEVNLPDAINLYVGIQGETVINGVNGDISTLYDFHTHQNVSDALANVAKYQDFYLILKQIGYLPESRVVVEAVAQAQAMVDAALTE